MVGFVTEPKLFYTRVMVRVLPSILKDDVTAASGAITAGFLATLRCVVNMHLEFRTYGKYRLEFGPDNAHV